MEHDANPARAIGNLACEVQRLLRRIEHLCAAIDDATDELHIADEPTRTAVDRVQVFADLIREAAVAAGDQAEEIERGAKPVKLAS
jgi:hypothetical protein